jgi:excisionase family DNA binding protein
VSADLTEALADALAERVAAKVLAQLPREAPSSPWMDLDQAAEYTAIRRGTFRQLVQQGKIPGHKAGKRYVFHRDEVDAALGYARPSNVSQLRRAS